MGIDAWVGGCKVRSFPWIDGEHIYFNVQYYRPGQSISQPPAWDKTAGVNMELTAVAARARQARMTYGQYVASIR